MQKLIKLSILFLFVSVTGCMEIENRIIIQMDGSAVIKESIKIHRELLDFNDESGKPIMMVYLEKTACENRAKAFGIGAVLKSHAIKNLNNGVKLLEAEYFIPDINNLNLINPFISYGNFKDMGLAKFVLRPKYTVNPSDHPYGVSGQMSVLIVSEKKGIVPSDTTRPSPLVLQQFRDLQPIFKDLLKEFKISVIFESYAPIVTSYGYRNKQSAPRSCEIFSFSGADYDRSGGLILDNDEIMQELLRQSFWEENIVNTTKDFANNLSVPIICTDGPFVDYRIAKIASRGISFKPSRQMFDKYFEGKNIDTYSVRTPFKAEFDKIGFDPAKDFRNNPKKVTPENKASTENEKPKDENDKVEK